MLIALCKDPLKRAMYVLSQEGFDIGEQRSKDVPPELLEEVFELNMALEEMRGGDDSARPQLESAGQEFQRMLSDVDAQFENLFEQYDPAPSRDTALRNPRRAEPPQIYSKPGGRSRTSP